MSHFSRLKTKIKDREILIRCLEELGYKVRHGGSIRGYMNSTQQVDLAISMTDGYDIGFNKDADGLFSIVADWWGVIETDEDSIVLPIVKTDHHAASGGTNRV